MVVSVQLQTRASFPFRFSTAVFQWLSLEFTTRLLKQDICKKISRGSLGLAESRSVKAR